jgi:hypothetical protein
MSRTTQILGFSVPPALAREISDLAKAERRTKSELFREMVRVYQRFRDQRDRDETRWVANIIQDAEADQTRNPMTVEEMLAESDRLARYGEKQATKLAVKPKDINRIIHEQRKTRRA